MVNRQKRYLMASSPWMLWWPKMPELPQTLRLWEQQSPHAWSQKPPTPSAKNAHVILLSKLSLQGRDISVIPFLTPLLQSAVGRGASVD